MLRKISYTLVLLFAYLQTFAQTYTYDDNYRLTKVVYSNGTTITYTYDALGNRLSKKVTGASSTTYKVTVSATPSGGGTVTGAGTYASGSTVELYANASAGYEFQRWTDGMTDNPRIVTVNGNVSYTAQFKESTINPTLLGDIIADGQINQQDLDALVEAYLNNTPVTKITDLDSDGSLTIADITKLISLLPHDATDDITDGLVAYYPFNGNANDESGNGNDGTVVGHVELTADRHGNTNGAYRFFGEPMNYISVPDNEILHLNSFTLSAWVYTDAEDYGSGYIINKGRDITNGSYRLCVRNVGAANMYGGVNDAFIDEDPSVKTWHMVSGTVEGDKAKFYLDGVLMDERKLSSSFSYSNSEPLVLGMHYYSGVPSNWAYPLLGVLDDVRLYNRVLTSAEIRTLYEGEKGSTSPSDDTNGHEYVDLGLPSGTLWATCNVGATTPEEAGCYFAAGETTGSCDGKNNFSISTYKYYNDGFTKYNIYPENGHNGYTDNLTALESSDDAATAKWEGQWRTPTKEEFKELINSNYTTWTWTSKNGTAGVIITSIVSGYEGNSIFLPAKGTFEKGSIVDEGTYGLYMSSTFDGEEEYFRSLSIRETRVGIGGLGRVYGILVRPVLSGKGLPSPPDDTDLHESVDLGLPSGTLWATCNIGATNSEDVGDYFAWGETEPKDSYVEDNYSFSIPAGTTELNSSSDAATAQWGSRWQMPSKDQFKELINESYTTSIWTTRNNVSGRLVTSKSNGNSIFLPATGFRYDTSRYSSDAGYYYSRTIGLEDGYYGFSLLFSSSNITTSDSYVISSYGACVRPVVAK